MTIKDACAELQELQVLRFQLMRIQNALNSQSLAFTRRHIGFSAFDKAPTRTQICTWAKNIVKQIRSGDFRGLARELVDTAAPLVLMTWEAQQMFQPNRKQCEKDMVRYAELLPAYEWWCSQRGLSVLSLACLIGETGDLNNYSNPAKVWKRMGLAVIDGERQRKVGSNPKLAIRHGYCPRRRSVVWNIGDAMIKARGAYYELYLERKRYETEKFPEGRPAVWHNRAKRYMEKRILRDLWRVWTGRPIDVEHYEPEEVLEEAAA